MTMHYRRIIAAFAGEPLMLLPARARQIAEFLALKAHGAELTPAEIEARIGRPLGHRVEAPILVIHDALALGEDVEIVAATDREIARQPGQVAVINIMGLISQRISGMDEISGPGGTSTERVAQAFRQAMADPNVKAIILQIDSPGGGVFGVDELATLIRDSRGARPIIAQVNAMAASAAYYIASAADEIVVTPSGEVGSIGVFTVIEDWSRFYEQHGVTLSLIKAGKFKAELNDFTPMSDEARSALQVRIDQYYTMFVSAVAKGRGVAVADVRNGFGEGRMVGARDAMKGRMADRVATMDETLARFGVKPGPAAPKAGEIEPPLRAEQLAAQDGPRQIAMTSYRCAIEGHEHTSEADAQACIDEVCAQVRAGEQAAADDAGEPPAEPSAGRPANDDLDWRMRRNRRRALI